MKRKITLTLFAICLSTFAFSQFTGNYHYQTYSKFENWHPKKDNNFLKIA